MTANQTDYKVVFLLGSPRSGTTWMQLLLHQSPDVATAPETQIFAYYLDHFRKQWAEEHTGRAARDQGGAGLRRLLSQEGFLDLCAHTASFVLDRIHDSNPDASVVLEKSPRHATIADWILDVLPDAYILHVIRDPRDAVASIMEAGRSWGESWAPRNGTDAARLWEAHVEGAIRAAGKAPGQYHEVRYEALREAPIPVLRRTFEWLGIPRSEEFCAAAVEACDLERLRSKGSADPTNDLPTPAARSPKGFFGKGTVGGWEHRISRSSVRSVESVVFDLMKDLGYTPELVSSGRRTARVAVHDAIQRIRESVDWQLERLLHHV